MSRKLLVTAALVCCFIIGIAATVAGLSGKWKGNLRLPDGQDVVVTYTINVAGDKLDGTAETFGHSIKIDDGKVSGNDFTFNITNNDGIIIPHTGKFYPEADSVGMSIDYGGAKFHTTLTRDK